MTTPNVTLLANGVFEIRTPFLGAYDYRIRLETEEEHHPWQVTQKFTGGDTWKFASSFSTLDEALDWCVSSANGVYPVQPYGVSLPCGSYFSRPGRIPAEKVMSGMGWRHVTYISGSAAKDFGLKTTHEQARAYFELLTDETMVVLGEVLRCQNDENDRKGKSLWIGEMKIAINNFMHEDEITVAALDMFDEEGIKVLEHIEYVYREQGTPHNATILEFPVRAAFEADGSACAGAEAVG